MKNTEQLEGDFTIRRDAFYNEVRFKRRSIEIRFCDSRSIKTIKAQQADRSM